MSAFLLCALGHFCRKHFLIHLDIQVGKSDCLLSAFLLAAQAAQFGIDCVAFEVSHVLYPFRLSDDSDSLSIGLFSYGVTRYFRIPPMRFLLSRDSATSASAAVPPQRR